MEKQNISANTLIAESTDFVKLKTHTFILFTILGLVLGLNQFGDSALKIFSGEAWLHSLIDPIINVNTRIDQSLSIWLFIVVISISLLTFLILRSGLKKSFGYGIIVGFLTLPVLVIMAGLAALILFVIFKIIGWIVTALMWVFTPVFQFLGWLFKPISLLLYKLYLWMKPVLDVIAIPFVWLFSFLWNYILKYLVMLAGAIILLLACIFPFVTLGTVVFGNYKDSITKPIGHISAFSVGIGLGFLIFDIIISLILNYYHVLPGHTYVICIFTLLTLLLAIIFLMRIVLTQGPSQQSVKFWDLTTYYVKIRYLDMITLICMSVLVIIISVFSQPEDS